MSVAPTVSPFIRVDSPTDVLYLEPGHPYGAAAKWKLPDPTRHSSRTINHRAVGNGLFAQKKFLLAKEEYSRGIHASREKDNTAELALLHLNRAAANLKLDYFSSAHDDTCEALGLLREDDHTQRKKALIRKATALEGMRLLRRSLDAFHSFADQYPEEATAKDGLQRLCRKIRESETGTYDWTEFVLGKGPHDIGDYIGPIRVEKLSTRGGGRGVVATHDLKAGDLLVVERALALGKPSLPGQKTSTLYFNPTRERSATSADVLVDTNLISRLVDDPSLRQVVYSLHGGPHFPPSLGLATVSLQERPWPVSPPLSIDTGRIEEITSYNSFGSDDDGYTPKRQSSQIDSATALFVQSSLFNHACLPNATWRNSPDSSVIIVRARTAIREGEEIFISYQGAAERGGPSRILSKHFPDGGCPCQICEDDRADDNFTLRLRFALIQSQQAQIEAQFSSFGSVSPSGIKDLEDLLANLEKTYPIDHSPIRPHLCDVYQIMANSYLRSGRYRESVDCYLRTLTSLGVVIHTTLRSGADSPITRYTTSTPIRIEAMSFGESQRAEGVLLEVATIFLLTRNVTLASHWMKMSLKLAMLEVGSTKDLFRRRHNVLLTNPVSGLRVLSQIFDRL